MLFGKICVAMFSFISGYGFYFSFQKDSSIQSCVKRAVGVYIDYWCILALMIPIYVAAGNTIVLQELIASIFAVGHEFNYFSWYVWFYFISAIVLYMINCKEKKLGCYLGIMVVCIIAGFIVKTEAFIYFATILMGYIVAKYGIFDFVYEKSGLSKKRSFLKIVFSMFLWIMIFVFRYIGMRLTGNHYLDFIWGSITVFAVAVFADGTHLRNNRVISTLSKATGDMWYLHAVFFGSYATLTQWFVYIPRVSVLVIMWAFSILAPMAIVMGSLQRNVKSLFFSPLAVNK